MVLNGNILYYIDIVFFYIRVILIKILKGFFWGESGLKIFLIFIRKRKSMKIFKKII